MEGPAVPPTQRAARLSTGGGGGGPTCADGPSHAPCSKWPSPIRESRPVCPGAPVCAWGLGGAARLSCLMCSHRATLPSRIHIRPPTLPRSHGRRGTYTHRRCRTLLTARHCSGYRVAWSQVLLFRIRPTSSAPLPFVSSLPPAFPAPARRRTSCCCCCCCHGCEVAWVKVVPVCPSFAIFSGPDLSRPAGDGRGWTKTKRRLFQVVIKRLAHPSPCSPATCPATLPVSCCEVVSNPLQARRVALATAPTCSTRRTRTTPGPATACHRAHRAAACHRFDSPSPVTRRHHPPPGPHLRPPPSPPSRCSVP